MKKRTLNPYEALRYSAHPVDRLVYWIRERHAIYLRRSGGQAKPWTDDPILQKYRFCNLYRNLDTQTVLLHENWVHPHASDPDLWFACVVARLVNWWPTLEAVGYPLPWRPNAFVRVMHARRDAKQKVYTGAYMIHAAPERPGDSKAEFQAHSVFTPLWEAREALRPRYGDTLEGFATRLGQYKDMGTFIVAQAIADAKYAKGSHLAAARDWDSWAANGPGSRRGLNRIYGLVPTSTWKQDEWFDDFAALRELVEPRIKGLPPLTAQDFQSSLCEFDKYERVRLGEGKPRSLYPGEK